MRDWPLLAKRGLTMSENRKGCDRHDPDDSPSASPILGGATEETFRVSGMDCSEEVTAIERALKPIGGVLGVRANLVASCVTVYHDGSAQSAKLIEEIERSGVKVETAKPPPSGSHVSLALRLVGTSGLFTCVGIILQWLGRRETLWPDVAFTMAIIAGGALVFPKALRSLKTFSFDMNVLMTVAVVGAVAIGDQAEGAAVVFLFSLSELLESWSVGRARRAIQALMQFAPETALVKREGKIQEVPAMLVAVGETILVKSGQRVPLDGTVLTGSSTVDQAPITGESIPVEKNSGDAVLLAR